MTFWEFTSAICVGFAAGQQLAYFRKRDGESLNNPLFILKLLLLGLMVLAGITFGTKLLIPDKPALDIARTFIWLAFGVFLFWKTRRLSA